MYPHLIMHTPAAHLVESGMSIEDFSLFLSHEDIATTKAYIQSSVKTKRDQLAKVQDMDPQRLTGSGFWKGNEVVLASLKNVR